MLGLNSALLNKTHKWHLQFMRYLLIGGLATVIDMGALYCLTEYAGIHYLVSAAAGFSLGTLLNYCLCIIWVFPERKHKRGAEITLFTLVGIIGLALNQFILFILVEFLSFWYMFAKIIAVAVGFIWNFTARKLLIFSK